MLTRGVESAYQGALRAFQNPMLALLHQTHAPFVVTVLAMVFTAERPTVTVADSHAEINDALDQLRAAGYGDEDNQPLPTGNARDLCRQWVQAVQLVRQVSDNDVDVYRMSGISAEKRDLEGRHVAVYDHIGEKSGGESQELVAFIVGAALRYQLGDAGAERPRYAPVFLDEALIKADAHFTGRAIGAWRGLGFQLVIGAPNDKHSAIEPHVDAEYLILKNSQRRSWAKPLVGVPDA